MTTNGGGRQSDAGSATPGSVRAIANRRLRSWSAQFGDSVGNLDPLAELWDLELLEQIGVQLEQNVTGDLVFYL
jgi:hypothetical protein